MHALRPPAAARAAPFYLAALLAFGTNRALCAAFGVELDLAPLSAYWQYLDPLLLKTDLLASLARLHSQPPLFNALLGLVLKAFDRPEAPFATLFALLALGVLLALARLLRLLRVPLPLAVLALFGVAVHPTFLVASQLLFYVTAVQLLLLLSVAELCAGRPVPWRVGLAMGALMLTRALYHPVWAVGALAAAALPLPRAARVRLAAVTGVAVAVTLGWYAKNAALVGSFSGSSWTGMNVARVVRGPQLLPVATEEIEAGRASPVLSIPPFRAPQYYEPLGFFPRPWVVPPGGHPALDAVAKSDGRKPNYNHREYARVSRAYAEACVEVIRAAPGAYVRAVLSGLDAFLQPTVVLERGTAAKMNGEALRAIAAWVDRLLLFDLGLWLWFPGGLLAAALLAWRGAGSAPERSAVAFGVATCVFVAIASSCLELGENARIRNEIDPVFAALLAWVVARAAEAWRARALARPAPNGAGS